MTAERKAEQRWRCNVVGCPNGPAFIPAAGGCTWCDDRMGVCTCIPATDDEKRAAGLLPPLPTESEPERETIVGPAIMWPDGRSFSWMPTPGSHYAVSEEMKRQTPHPSTTPLKWPQGFVTSEHRFVNRKVARQIAEEAGQIVNPITEGEDLFSEELWTPSPAPEPEREVCGVAYPEDGGDLDGSFTVCQNARPCDNHESAPETPSPEVGMSRDEHEACREIERAVTWYEARSGRRVRNIGISRNDDGSVTAFWSLAAAKEQSK